MRVLQVRQRSLKLILVLGLAVVALSYLSSYFAAPDLATVDMAVLANRTIAIDPGHGGIDGGATYNGTKEKEINLAIAMKLADVLRESGVNVVFTRDKDIDYYTKGKGGKRNDLEKRIEIINNSGAEATISIHTNAIRGNRWFGAEVYYNPARPENRLLAEVVQHALREFPPGNKRQPKEDTDILLLKDITMSGILVEAGFLSNPKEAALLADSSYQQKMAEQIARALAYHFSHNVGR